MGVVVRASRRFMERTGRAAWNAMLAGQRNRLYTYFNNVPETQWLQLAACMHAEAINDGSRMRTLIINGRNLVQELEEFQSSLD
jgi:hypothetical protein